MPGGWGGAELSGLKQLQEMKNGPVHYPALSTCQSFHILQCIYFVYVNLFKIFFPTGDKFPASDLAGTPEGFHCFLSHGTRACDSLLQRKIISHIRVFLSKSHLSPFPLQPSLSSRWRVLAGMPAAFLVTVNRCLSSEPDGKLQQMAAWPPTHQSKPPF